MTEKIKLYCTEQKVLVAEEIEPDNGSFYVLKNIASLIAVPSKTQHGKMDFSFLHYFIPILSDYADFWNRFEFPSRFIVYTANVPNPVAVGYEEYRKAVTASLSGIHIVPPGGEKTIAPKMRHGLNIVK